MAGARGVVLYIALAGYAVIERREVGAGELERRREEDAVALRREQARHCDADAQEARAVGAGLVYEALEQGGNLLRELLRASPGGPEIHRAVGELVELEVGRGEAQAASRDADADGVARVGDNLYPQRPAAAGAPHLAAVAHEPVGDELREILIDGRQAQPQRLRQGLAGRHAVRLVYAVVYGPARHAAPVGQ